jgi:excisionase family DNA binding protein
MRVENERFGIRGGFNQPVADAKAIPRGTTMSAESDLQSLKQLRSELQRLGRTDEIEALDRTIDRIEGEQRRRKPKTYLKLKKKYYTPAEVARRVGVSRQTIVKWIERGELDAELTPGGHHRIPASVFHREGRGEPVQLIPVEEE